MRNGVAWARSSWSAVVNAVNARVARVEFAHDCQGVFEGVEGAEREQGFGAEAHFSGVAAEEDLHTVVEGGCGDGECGRGELVVGG